MRKVLIIFSILLLCSCDHFEQDRDAAEVQAKQDAKTIQNNVSKNAMRVADNVRDSIKRTNERVRDWWITPLPKEVKHEMPTRYCYRVLQDILCYRQQMLGWESKLVGYQGMGAEPPVPVTMKLLPLRADDPSTLPENRAASAKPVFVSMPIDEKELKNLEKSDEPITIDSTHETLPDSALSPQL